MATANQQPRAGDTLLMVGTRKGSFLFWSDSDRLRWQRTQSHLGWSVHSLAYDPRHNAIYAATNSAVFGALAQRSDDGGQSWSHVNHGLDFTADDDRRVREIWQIEPGHRNRPDRVWVGTGDAGLFRSDDRGQSWAEVGSLNRRREDDRWQPGGGGLILHTIVVDPNDEQRLYAAVSAGGAYRSDDGAATWKPINRNVRADFLPDPLPETGQCVHKIVMHPGRPHVLFQQNHCGVYRSDDHGDNWIDISDGLPSRFGFPMAIHPHDPETIYVVPLVSDEQRFVPDGQMAVWRSRDAGNSWRQMSEGLPDNAWLVILRESLATDQCSPAGVYVGTTGGSLFHSRDEGDTWHSLAEHLPPILSVSAAEVVA